MDAVSQAASYCFGGTRALLLPSADTPRVLVPNVGLRQRWSLSAIYPAFRLRAMPWRLLQRIRAVFFVGRKVSLARELPIERYMQDVLPDTTHASVLLGIDNSYRKIMVQVWSGDHLKAYLKCSTNGLSAQMVAHEASILSKLPPGAGPGLLKQGRIEEAETLLQTAVAGNMLKADVHSLLEMLPLLKEYLSHLYGGESFDIDDHPAIVLLRKKLTDFRSNSSDVACPLPDASLLGRWLEPLRERDWSLVIQHGDFTPWNIIRRKAVGLGKRKENPAPSTQCLAPSALCAIDWEEATLDGFPYFDLVYSFLQTACLIHRWSAGQAFPFTVKALQQCGVDRFHADSLIRLSALDAYLRFSTRSGDKSNNLQQFRLAIINHDLPTAKFA